MQRTSNTLLLAQYFVIVAAALAISLPCLVAGIPPGYDAPSHISYQHYFSQQFWNGEQYPRWLTHSNKGYGSPTFFIQYPLPYFGTALLRVVHFAPSPYREARELGLFCFLVIAGSGFAARFWFRKRCGPFASTLGAIVYISLPYVLGCLYPRTALGELTAFVWMPLAFAMCDSLSPKAICALGVLVALLIVSSPLIALLCVPGLIIYTAAAGDHAPRRILNRLTLLLSGLILSLGISAVYTLPFVKYRSFFDASQMQADLPGFELGSYFAFLMPADPALGKLVGVVLLASLILCALAMRAILRAPLLPKARLCIAILIGLGLTSAMPGLGPRIVQFSRLRVSGFDTPVGFSAGILVTALLTMSLGILAYCRVSRVEDDSRNTGLLVIASCAFFFMLPWSAPVWRVISPLSLVQFPFRWGGLLTLAVAGLVAMAMDVSPRGNKDIHSGPSRTMLTIVVLATLTCGVAVWRVDRNFRWPSSRALETDTYVDINYRMYVPPDRIVAFAKRLGTRPDIYEVNPTPAEEEVRAEFVRGQGLVSLKSMGPREYLISTDSSGDSLLQITQLEFPLWKIVSDRAPSDALAIESSPEGLLQVRVPGGRHEFRLVLAREWPEKYGLVLTLLSLLGVGVFCWFYRQNVHP